MGRSGSVGVDTVVVLMCGLIRSLMDWEQDVTELDRDMKRKEKMRLKSKIGREKKKQKVAMFLFCLN